MLDIRFVRENPELVTTALSNRNSDIKLDEFIAQDVIRRELLQQVEQLKARRNSVTVEISRMKKAGLDATEIILEMRTVGEEIAAIDARVREVETAMEVFLLNTPNCPDQSVPVGSDERDNKEIKRVGVVREFDFAPRPHWEIGEQLGILDFERGGKVTGARFTFYVGMGARLERALINFMMDLHSNEHGYTEMFPPFIANADSMRGTGQLPKFTEDMFKLEGLDYYLIPTAEVPVTNYHRDEILLAAELPKRYCAYSACFRAEAGAAGRDTRGLIRQHQFNKVELVKFTWPEDSYAELETLTGNAEAVLEKLGLPYRRVLLCTGDMGFSAAKTYDLEVWLPSFNMYREISSCSNFEDFQARRMNARFRREIKAKPEHVHTLNGSGLAVGRTVAAILENYQQADGSVVVPEALRSYMGVDVIK
ncbi:MAG: serine--tRNA ligase [Negativicutes bacterium]|jgi:seryl-tRNA synthetase